MQKPASATITRADGLIGVRHEYPRLKHKKQDSNPEAMPMLPAADDVVALRLVVLLV